MDVNSSVRIVAPQLQVMETISLRPEMELNAALQLDEELMGESLTRLAGVETRVVVVHVTELEGHGLHNRILQFLESDALPHHLSECLDVALSEVSDVGKEGHVGLG